MAKPIGNFSFVLHSHIPYVISHGRSPHGTDWLSEAAAETYLPLLETCHRLVAEGISPKLTIGFTPVLVEQLRDTSFQNEFLSYLHAKIDTSASNETLFRSDGNYHMAYLARFWFDWYSARLVQFEETCQRDIVGSFGRLQSQGHVEIISGSATHGYSALLSQDTSIQAQVKQGIQNYEKTFGRKPAGYWLPECSYRPRYPWTTPTDVPTPASETTLRKGVDEFLSENDIKYFFVDGHMLAGGEPLGVYGEKFGPLNALWENFHKQTVDVAFKPYSPYRAYNVNSSGNITHPSVAVLGRDSATGAQVWSGDQGYPGDQWYLEFHKKFVGVEDQTLGLRYWRISENKQDLGSKCLYEPHRAESVTRDHAHHFADLVHGVMERNADPKSIICSVYDTELFGHWWFEGPQWLYHAIRALSNDESIKLTTVSEYLDAHPDRDSINLPEGSWGEGGFHYIWLNEQTAWSWVLVYEVEQNIRELAQNHANNPQVARVLKQACREALLLMASDWQFCISTGGAKDYSEIRLRNHYDNYKALAHLVKRLADGDELSIGDWKNISECEERDQIFSDIDPNWFIEPAQSIVVEVD